MLDIPSPSAIMFGWCLTVSHSLAVVKAAASCILVTSNSLDPNSWEDTFSSNRSLTANVSSSYP